MPRATLVHNTTAGDGRPSGSELRDIVERHGYSALYATTESDIDVVLQDPGDLVVVAGGDGTVGRVAARLLGTDVPLAIFPVGTANNLATSIGVTGPVDRIAAAWDHSEVRLLDVGIATGPWGARPLVESFGLGLFAHAMPVLSALKQHAQRPPGREAAVRQDRAALARLAEEFAPRTLDLRIDGSPVQGPYLVVAVMNATMLGPRLRLAPRADPGDGLLDVVLVREGDRRALADCLKRGAPLVAGLDAPRARTVDLLWDGDPLHIDGESWAGETAAFRSTETVPRAHKAPVQVTLEPEKVMVLVPRGAGSH